MKTELSPPPAPDANAKVAASIETPHEAGQRLEAPTPGKAGTASGHDERLWRHARTQLPRGEARRQAAILNAHRQAKDDLRESERRFSDMLGNVELVSLMLDREGRITYCNEYLLRNPSGALRP